METIENNKLMAEFMGNKNYSYCNNDNAVYFNLIDNKGKEIKGNYDSDWNWLMQAVEKIDSVLPDDSVITIQYKDCHIPVNEGEFDIYINATTKIEAVYNACVEFIKWYNENK
jgi:hypothetical protein